MHLAHAHTHTPKKKQGSIRLLRTEDLPLATLLTGVIHGCQADGGEKKKKNHLSKVHECAAAQCVGGLLSAGIRAGTFWTEAVARQDRGEEGREQVLGRDKSRQGNIAVFLFLEEGIKLSGMNHKLTNPEEWLD